jgi:hypothetical protein
MVAALDKECERECEQPRERQLMQLTQYGSANTGRTNCSCLSLNSFPLLCMLHGTQCLHEDIRQIRVMDTVLL